MKTKLKDTKVQFFIGNQESLELKKKMKAFGFSKFSTFYEFITTNILQDNVSIHIEPKRELKFSSEFKKKIEEIDKLPEKSWKEVTDVKAWANSIKTKE